MSEGLTILEPSLAGAGERCSEELWGGQLPSPPADIRGPTRKLSGHREVHMGPRPGGRGFSPRSLGQAHASAMPRAGSRWGRPTSGSCGASETSAITISPAPLEHQSGGGGPASIRSAAWAPGVMGAEATPGRGLGVAGPAAQGDMTERRRGLGFLVVLFL